MPEKPKMESLGCPLENADFAEVWLGDTAGFAPSPTGGRDPVASLKSPADITNNRFSLLLS